MPCVPLEVHIAKHQPSLHTQRKRQAVAAVYESKPMPGDHPTVKGEERAGWNVGS